MPDPQRLAQMAELRVRLNVAIKGTSDMLYQIEQVRHMGEDLNAGAVTRTLLALTKTAHLQLITLRLLMDEMVNVKSDDALSGLFDHLRAKIGGSRG